ncbi:ABC transporter permease [Fulvivirga lutea]|uniref:ABC transporter permease n=1 Tax=Fulvivirga lutea TaxID=2810512 RepID=A0A974WKP7_9BACT|nr:ABC transporter permease [Fulvivirga lutea]QSE98977.1 ABC transporter permease [Fulvivirga lutea]
MFKNNFKVALRNLQRSKAYAFINIIGLTIGLTGACLLSMHIKNELSFDKFHSKSDRIARIVEEQTTQNNSRLIGRTSYLTGPELLNEFDRIEEQTRILQPFGHLDIIWNGERISERKWILVDSTFFHVFDFHLLEGDRRTALDKPNSAILTQSSAQKYYGNESPVGKIIEFSGMEPMLVTGVLEDAPYNSHLQFDVMITMNSAIQNFPWWERLTTSPQSLVASTYFVFDQPESIQDVASRLGEWASENRDQEYNETRKLMLQPMEEAYLSTDNVEFAFCTVSGSKENLYLFGALAIFLIVIACINYINLATSKSMERAKEIGIRKVSGAYRNQLIAQFLTESVAISLISFFLSLLCIDLVLPIFSEITESTIITAFTIENLLLLGGLTLFIGLFSGIYPAIHLSRLQPAASLKSSNSQVGGAGLRKVLVITQFTLSIFMIVATVVVTNQMQFLKNKDLGFDEDRMLVIDINNGNVRNSFEAMKNEFSKINGVTHVASSSRVPGEWKNIREVMVRNAENDSSTCFFMGFDEAMMATYDLNLLEGRNFSGNLAEDSSTVILNQRAAKILGDLSIGDELRFPEADYPIKVIGIVEDFNFQSLHNEIGPLVIGHWFNTVAVIDYFSLKINKGASLQQVVADAKKVHEQFDDTTPMEFHFLDEQIDQFYRTEQKAQSIFSIGAGLTMIIACMGLFGLASFVVQKRTKEIGIRKILGASEVNLMIILSATFTKQVLVSLIIAIPLSFYVMDQWLNNFAYRKEINMSYFLIAGLLAVSIALITVSYRVIKAALLNPVDTLRNE